MKRYVAVLVLISYLFLPGTVSAQDSTAEQITSFDTEVRIDQDNVAHIKETIVYDFGLNQRRGIFRYVPVRTQAEGTDKFYYYNVTWGSILRDGQPSPVDSYENTSEYTLAKIGDADVYISGPHTYEINYTLSPIAEQDEGGDFINLNITGNDWGAPIRSASTKVTMDNGSKVINARCYTGPVGATTQDCTKNINGRMAEFSAKNLAAYEGLTINMLVEEGNFNTYLFAQDPPPLDLRPGIGLAIGILAFIFGILLRIKSWITYKRRLADETIVPQYEPPKDLSVGEIGLLHDNKSDMKEITATLIDLAVRGYIRITQTREKSTFKSAEYEFELIGDKKQLGGHEAKLINLIFSNNETKKALKDLDRTKAAGRVSSIKTDLSKKLEKKGLRHKQGALQSTKTINKIFGFIALGIIFWTAYFVFAEVNTGIALAPTVVLSGAGLIMLGLGAAASTRIEVSEEGYDKWAEIEGLIMYLTVAEKDRLAFHNAPEKKPEHFSALLPAAIALGVDKQWANQFKDLDVSEQIDWYRGNSTLNSVLLANSLSRDFGSVVSSSFRAPSQSSSGFSGGGFSGGGGGGGGGGSW